jgi:hypothetical protein
VIRPAGPAWYQLRPLTVRGCLGPCPLWLVLDPDAVCHSRHVVEVADHLDRVGDGRVVEAVRSKRVDVGLVDLSRTMGELDREVAERALARREVRLAIVVLCVLRGLLVCALGTEVVGVRDRSVVTALLGRSHRRQELSLAA